MIDWIFVDENEVVTHYERYCTSFVISKLTNDFAHNPLVTSNFSPLNHFTISSNCRQYRPILIN